jgi:hypothetical protein
MIKRKRDILVGLGTALAGALLSLAAARRMLKPQPHIGQLEKAAFAVPNGEGYVGENHDQMLTPAPSPAHASTRSPVPSRQLQPGWNAPQPEHLPEPTYWPVVMALGVTLLLWGVATTWIMSVVGLAVLALSLIGWIGELLHENPE